MIRPDSLKAGDRVMFIAPSRVIERDQINEALRILETWGLEVIQANHLFSKHGYFAGTDAQRLDDLQKAIDDTEVKAVFCARGGYGMTRVLDSLDMTALRVSPKWIIGFSDITALHLALNKYGIESIHGLMPVQFEYMGIEDSLASLRKLLFEGRVSYQLPGNARNVNGEALGELVGGNLSLVTESLGTSTEINTNGKILYLEEIDEYLYKIDRMLNQLKRAGKFDGLSGVIIGDFSHMKDTQIPFGVAEDVLIMSYFNDLNIPVVYGFPSGHEAYNLALPNGREVRLSVSKESISLMG